MSTFSFIVNCIILAVVVCVQVIVAGPQGLGTTQNSTILPSESHSENHKGNHVPCTRNETKPTCHCPEPCHGPCPDHNESSRRHHRIQNLLVEGMICSCDPGTRRIPIRDDYLFTPDIGSHKFHIKPTTWNNARKMCNEEGGHLAIVNSKAEAQVLTKIFDQAGQVTGAAFPDEAFLGIHDLYVEGDWVTILGDPLAKTGYSWWSDKWGGQPDNGGGVQNCGAILKDGKLDDVQCEANFPFFCELPIVNYI